MHYIYHIPGKKVGVTTNISKRVIETQGYKPGEYEILHITGSATDASKKEIELQKKYGYKQDITSYKQLIINKMKQNVTSTEATTTFYVPRSEIKDLIMKLLDVGFTWKNGEKEYKITKQNYNWIIKNVHPSQFSDTNCFMYNKAFEEFNESNTEKPLNVYNLIRDWANNRGIYSKGNSNTQYIKLMEEAGELAQGLLKKDKLEIKDAIGDMVVVLTNLAHLENMKIEDCVTSAYDVIAKRKGKMVNGTFVKQL